jgi:V8-like Glu-specific endopeptidase
MKQALLALVLLAVPSYADNDSIRPDETRVLNLMGRFLWGHACMVAPGWALTNAHIADLMPFDASVPLFGLRFATTDDRYQGYMHPFRASTIDDLAIGSLVDLNEVAMAGPVPYTLAEQAPTPGETLYWVGYDWKRRKNVADRLHLNARVLRVVAGHVFMDRTTYPGSSGSCVLNENGELVGLVTGAMSTNDRGSSAVITGLWGEWGRRMLALIPPKEEPVEEEKEP